MKVPPWHRDLVEVAALPPGDIAWAATDPIVPAVVVFIGPGAWERARIAKAELWLAECDGHGRGTVTLVPPGESPWAYNWRALLNQHVTIYSTDADAAAWAPLRDALLYAGAARVTVVDGRREQPRPVIAEFGSGVFGEQPGLRPVIGTFVARRAAA